MRLEGTIVCLNLRFEENENLDGQKLLGVSDSNLTSGPARVLRPDPARLAAPRPAGRRPPWSWPPSPRRSSSQRTSRPNQPGIYRSNVFDTNSLENVVIKIFS